MQRHNARQIRYIADKGTQVVIAAGDHYLNRLLYIKFIFLFGTQINAGEVQAIFQANQGNIFNQSGNLCITWQLQQNRLKGLLHLFLLLAVTFQVR